MDQYRNNRFFCNRMWARGDLRCRVTMPYNESSFPLDRRMDLHAAIATQLDFTCYKYGRDFCDDMRQNTRTRYEWRFAIHSLIQLFPDWKSSPYWRLLLQKLASAIIRRRTNIYKHKASRIIFESVFGIRQNSAWDLTVPQHLHKLNHTIILGIFQLFCVLFCHIVSAQWTLTIKSMLNFCYEEALQLLGST